MCNPVSRVLACGEARDPHPHWHGLSAGELDSPICGPCERCGDHTSDLPYCWYCEQRFWAEAVTH